MRKQILVVILCGFLGINFTLQSTPISQTGAMYLQPAWNLAAHEFTLAVSSQFYARQQLFDRTDADDYAVTFRTFSSNLGVYYGAAEKIELGIIPKFYQKFHQGSGGINKIQDVQFQVKFSPPISMNRNVHFGFALTGLLPCAAENNLALEPYTSGRGAVRLMTMFSYCKDMLQPETVFNMHINFGYQHHLDVGKEISNSKGHYSEVINPTQELLLGLGMIIPANPVKLRLTLHGNLYIQKPPAAAYYRNHNLFFSPEIQIPLIRNFKLNGGVDFRLSQSDKTVFYKDAGWNAPDLQFHFDRTPAWRFQLGIEYTFQVKKKQMFRSSLSQPVGADTTQANTNPNPELQEYDMREIDYDTYKQERKKEFSRESIEKLKAERVERDRLLETLRKEIERRSGNSEAFSDTSTANTEKNSTPKKE